ncbi:MAG TPA: DegV family protein, partial [Spirochaetales bacterium]|nr:DegV family protein [Spirochaetales bacterium]
MHIAYLDGHRLSRALVAGARRLQERAGRLNAINVFPVPDGDTGTNMAGTARAMALRLEALPAGSLGFGAAMRAAADSALRGARGNSGAILAQFLHGLAEELEGEARIGTRRFAEAARSAARRARAALSKPREGTIVTVLTDWAEAAHRVAAKTDDFLVLLKAALEEARASLARTPDLLPELKKAGVVDAGAEGFVHILEGIWAYVSGGRLRDRARAGRSGAARHAERPADEALPGAGSERAHVADGLAESLSAAEDSVLPGLSDAAADGGHEESAFRYCTECLVTGEGLDLEALRAGLVELGDSLVVAGSSTLARVHLHTDRPQAAFRLLAEAGSGASAVEGQKVDDMELQRRLSAAPRRPAAVLTDTACDLPDALGLELLADRAAVLVEIGGKAYLDRDGLSSDEFFGMLRADPAAPLRSSQPSHAAFSRKLDLLLERADEVVYVGLSAALSGTLEGGRRAAGEGPRAGRVRVVDTRSISVGAALVVR